MLKNVFKSAVAFFFLFFLNGISFGTRQQGISYNYLITATNILLPIHNR